MDFQKDRLDYLWENCDHPADVITKLAERLSARGRSFEAGEAYFYLAEKRFRTKFYDAALREFLLFVERIKAERQNDAALLALAYRKAGEACMHSSMLYREPTLAGDYLRSAYTIHRAHLPELAEELVLTCEMLAFHLFSIATEYRSEEVDLAIRYDREAIALLDKYFPNDSDWKGTFLRNLGYLHERQGDGRQAESCYIAALNLEFQHHMPEYQRRFCS